MFAIRTRYSMKRRVGISPIIHLYAHRRGEFTHEKVVVLGILYIRHYTCIGDWELGRET